MVQKNATPSKTLAEIIRRAGLDPRDYVVTRDLICDMLVRNRATGELKVPDK